MMNVATAVVWGGFGLAFIFGLVVCKTNFCTMGAVTDVVVMGHWLRARMWMLSVAAAILATSCLQQWGWVDIGQSIYQRPNLPWLSLLVGGLCFGIGMTVASGCVNKNLIRAGAGSGRSLVVLLVVGTSAAMSLRGLFARWRVDYLDPLRLDLSQWSLPNQGLPALLAHASGWSTPTCLWLCTVVIAGALAIAALKDPDLRRDQWSLLGSVMLGVLIAAAWYLTGHLGYAENPDTLELGYWGTNSHTLESFSFVAPVAYSLDLLTLWTDQSLHLSFGIAAAMGVALGSLVYALATGSWRWEGFASAADLRWQLLGAVLMGFGGVTALGCSIGQGMSGLSTLALGSLLALSSIVAGSVLTLKALQR